MSFLEEDAAIESHPRDCLEVISYITGRDGHYTCERLDGDFLISNEHIEVCAFLVAVTVP